jgi:hypothetical protein
VPEQEGATYEGVAWDPDHEGQVLVVMEGTITGVADARSHFVRMTRRNECEVLISIADTHTAHWISWAGR